MNFSVSNFRTDEKLFSIHINKNIYTGGTSTFLKDVSNNVILYKHDKSITHITSSGPFLACSSYDCTVSIFKVENIVYKLEDVIEGPDTEIKCVSFDSSNSWLAFATRGKSVWICRINEYIEIHKILEDHTEDVKGCLFFLDFFVSFGYDNTINLYQYFKYNEEWELVQEIEEEDTVWNVVFIEDRMYSCNASGEISLYVLDKGYTLKKRKKFSHLPILALCAYKNRLVAGLNLGDLIFLDLNLEIVHEMEKIHTGFINCVYYSEKDEILGTCSDDQTYNILKEEE
ncbi:putative cytosolic iron-sulfur assembly protein [Vairimorpha necatrix]|uniref:Cytosolic iron-sulfur assembly protein n=1 Tax=Vairimorpha necatrix TaxID=6039 RepID=A0AAX4JET0_9MICR